MELDETAQEILETLWIRAEEAGQESMPVTDVDKDGEEAIRQLLEADLVELVNETVKLTQKGLPEAKSVVRRHRLAERLLSDVLDTHGTLQHEKACKFEHLLDRGLDDSICTLLGHPRVCPHGKPIPPGFCCQQKEEEAQRVVTQLAEMDAGQGGKIAYIYAPEASKLQKLMSMGILPGAPIKLLQRFPSFVFEVRQSQFAVDRELANSIYVRLISDYNAPRDTTIGPRHRLRRRRGWWHRSPRP